MTVERLIEILKKQAQSRRVFVQGYEGGFHDEIYVYPTKMVLNENGEDYNGPHEPLDGREVFPGRMTCEDVIVIAREEPLEAGPIHVFTE